MAAGVSAAHSHSCLWHPQSALKCMQLSMCMCKGSGMPLEKSAGRENHDAVPGPAPALSSQEDLSKNAISLPHSLGKDWRASRAAATRDEAHSIARTTSDSSLGMAPWSCSPGWWICTASGRLLQPLCRLDKLEEVGPLSSARSSMQSGNCRTVKAQRICCQSGGTNSSAERCRGCQTPWQGFE